jgi:hypothetical protein
MGMKFETDKNEPRQYDRISCYDLFRARRVKCAHAKYVMRAIRWRAANDARIMHTSYVGTASKSVTQARSCADASARWFERRAAWSCRLLRQPALLVGTRAALRVEIRESSSS